jgi:hypothetical protein
MIGGFRSIRSDTPPEGQEHEPHRTPAVAQIVVNDQFNPSQSGGLCGLGVDPATGNRVRA